ncbi:hypothetical protein D3C72_1532560 [compost metagenome]
MRVEYVRRRGQPEQVEIEHGVRAVDGRCMRARVAHDLRSPAQHRAVRLRCNGLDQGRRSRLVVLAARYIDCVVAQHRQRLRRIQRHAARVGDFEHLEDMAAPVVMPVWRVIQRQHIQHRLARQEVETGQRRRPVRREARHLALWRRHGFGEHVGAAHPEQGGIAHCAIDDCRREVGLEAADTDHGIGTALVVAVRHAGNEVGGVGQFGGVAVEFGWRGGWQGHRWPRSWQSAGSP